MDYEGKAVIYKIINIENAKFYVGSTIALSARWRKHLRELRTNKHHCPHLQSAWNKYGESSFVFRVVEIVEDPRQLGEVEQRWLDKHHGTTACYNYAKYTDNSNRGVVRRDSHCQALSIALKEFYKTNPHPAKGKKHTEEAKQKMSKNRAGKPVSEATKDLIRQANLGKKASTETRAKLSAIHKGRQRTVEHAAKFNKPIIEITSGKAYPSLKAAKEAFDMSPGTLARALASDKPIARGKNKGKHFRYACP